MNRFLKTLMVLVGGLFLLATGIDVALDHVTSSPTQSSLTIYSEQGTVLLAYNGDLAACKMPGKASAAAVTHFLHRT